MATKANTTKSKSTTQRRTRAQVVELKPLAIQQELGRRRNNKERRRNGEPVVRSKAYYMPHLSRQEFDKVLAGETVDKTFNSGRKLRFKLAQV